MKPSFKLDAPPRRPQPLLTGPPAGYFDQLPTRVMARLPQADARAAASGWLSWLAQFIPRCARFQESCEKLQSVGPTKTPPKRPVIDGSLHALLRALAWNLRASPWPPVPPGPHGSPWCSLSQDLRSPGELNHCFDRRYGTVRSR